MILSKEIRMAKISQQQYEEYRSALKRMRMLDDTLMKCVFKDYKTAVELVLRIILQRDDLEVIDFTVSKEYKNLKGHSVCLDVIAVDKDGKHYNIEVQRDDRGAEPRRARFNSSMMDIEMLGKGEDPLGWLISDFRETDPEKMHYKVLAERVNYLKNDTKGEEEMCKIMEELAEKRFQKGIQKGRQEGRLEGRQEGRLEGIQKGIQITIKLYRRLGLSKEQIIEQLAAEYEIPQSEAAKYVYAE